MSKKVKVLNTRNRYYNGAHKGQIITIDEDRKDHYLSVGFVLADDVIKKNGIVNKPSAEEDTRTKADLKKVLDHYGVEYNKNSNRTTLLALVVKAEEKSEKEGNAVDVETIKKQLLENEIVTEEELKEMEDSEIIEAGKNNGLTE